MVENSLASLAVWSIDLDCDISLSKVKGAAIAIGRKESVCTDPCERLTLMFHLSRF